MAAVPRSGLDELSVPDDAPVVVLEGVEKPGNVGAVIRTADAAGASAVIVADAATDLFNPNAIRSSLGGDLQHAPRDCRHADRQEVARSASVPNIRRARGCPTHLYRERPERTLRDCPGKRIEGTVGPVERPYNRSDLPADARESSTASTYRPPRRCCSTRRFDRGPASTRPNAACHLGRAPAIQSHCRPIMCIAIERLEACFPTAW